MDSQNQQAGVALKPTVNSIESPDEQWLAGLFQLRKDLRFDLRRDNHLPVVVIEDPVRAKFFQVGQLEYTFIAKLNGVLTLREIVDSINQESAQAIDDSFATTIIKWLVQANLV
ncbi:MAG: hypothetical protein AAF623_19725, partial [Planctomycetota bacterium]